MSAELQTDPESGSEPQRDGEHATPPSGDVLYETDDDGLDVDVKPSLVWCAVVAVTTVALGAGRLYDLLGRCWRRASG